MREIKRVLCSKKHIAVFFLLLFVCVLAEQIDLKNQRIPTESYLDAKKAYVEEYNQFYDKILAETGSMKQIKLFSDENSFSYRNIEKTVRDYEPIQDLVIQVKDTRAEEYFLNTEVADILCFIYLLFFVTLFFEERKKEFWPLQYSTKKGGLRLLFWRFLSLICGSVLFFIILHIVRKISIELFFQKSLNIHLPVQSMEAYKNICFPFGMDQYFIYYFGIRILTSLLIGLFWWTILSFQKSNAVATIIFLVFLTIEYSCYAFISENSLFVFFRFCNIFSVIYPKEIIDRYLNLNVFQYPVGIHTMFLLCVAALSFLLLFLLFLMKKKQRPYMEYHKLLAYFDENWRGRFSFFSHLGMLSVEWYKILVSQKGFSILIVMAYFLVTFSGVPELHKGFQDAYCQELYQEYGGAVTEEKLQSLYDLSQDFSIKNYDKEKKVNQIIFCTKEGKGSIFLNKQVSAWILMWIVCHFFFIQEILSANRLPGGLSNLSHLF